MPIFQAFNKRINAWVKYEFGQDGFKVIDVKQQLPTVPFVGIPIRQKK